IWALGWGDLKSQSGAQRGVDIPAWNKAKTEDPSFLSKSVFAKAEFYYDIAKGGRPKWDTYKDDAMWNMRWRARLRRVKSPTSKLGALAGASIGDHMNDYLGKWLGNSDAAHAAIDWAKTWPDEMTQSVDQGLKDTVGVSAIENGFFTVIH